MAQLLPGDSVLGRKGDRLYVVGDIEEVRQGRRGSELHVIWDDGQESWVLPGYVWRHDRNNTENDRLDVNAASPPTSGNTSDEEELPEDEEAEIEMARNDNIVNMGQVEAVGAVQPRDPPIHQEAQVSIGNMNNNARAGEVGRCRRGRGGRGGRDARGSHRVQQNDQHDSEAVTVQGASVQPTQDLLSVSKSARPEEFVKWH